MRQNLQIQKKFLLKIAGFLAFFLLCGTSYLQAQQLPQGNITTSGTYTIPAGVTKVKIEAIGGGGAGGYTSTGWGYQVSGGGGGGAYACVNALEVTPGNTISITVGGGGSGTSGASNGGTSSVSYGGTVWVSAGGGSGVANNTSTGGTGGQATVGDIPSFRGGSGGNGASSYGGGGGGAAGRTGVGGNGVNATSNGVGRGGQGNAPGGNGGSGGSSAAGGAGNSYGGGGGGSSTWSIFGVQVTSNGGNGAPGVVIVTFLCYDYKLAAISSTLTNPVCQEATATTDITFTGISTKPSGNYTSYLPTGSYTATYTITTPDGTTTTHEDDVVVNITSGNNTSGTISGITIPTATAGTVTVKITNLEMGDCSNDITANNEINITVKPLPVLTLTTEAETVCSGTMVNPGLSSNISGTKYKITAVASSEQISGHTPSGEELDAFYADEILTNNGTTAGTVTYTITPTANGCTGAAKTYTVTVNAAATVDPVDNQVICNGGSTTPVEFTGTATSFQWEATGDAAAMGIPTGLQTGNFGTYPLSNSTTGILTATITVTPINNVNSSNSPCVGDESITFTVTVNPTPTITNTFTNQVICNGGSTTPVEFTGTATSFQWEATGYATAMGIPTDLQTGNFGTYPLSNSTTGILTATITVTPIYGANDAGTLCKGDAKSFTVTVNPTPTITNTFTNQVICNGGSTTPVEFTGTATSFQWEATGDVISGMPVGEQTGNFGTYPLSNSTTGILTATITVTPIYGANDAETPCKGDAKSFTVTVNPTPTITNTFTNQVICNGKQTTPVTFNGTATSFQWEATGDVITGMPVDLQTGNFGAYTLSNTTTGPLTATITVTPIYGANDAGTLCKGDAKSFTVTVNPMPQATISQDAEVCEGTEVTLTFTLTTGTLPWSVTYSDGSGSSDSGKTLTGATTTITDTVTPPVGTTSYYITEVTDGNGCVWPPQN